MADSDAKRTAYLWVGRAAGQELARRIARAGDRFVRAEAHPHPQHPDGVLWRVIVRDDLAGVEVQQAAEVALNDSWWCPPVCPGGDG